MAENFVSVRIKSVGTGDMVNLAKENFRIKQPHYTVISEPQVKVFMNNGRTLEILQDWTDEDKGKLEDYIKQELHKHRDEQIQRFRENHKTRTGKLRKWQGNQNTFSHVIISFTNEGFDKVVEVTDFMNVGNKWAKAWSERHGIKNVYTAFHFDETTPHIHLCFENIDATGSSFKKKITKQTLRECQDLAGEVFGELGFKRGVARELTGKSHEDAKAFNRRQLKEQEEAIEKNKSVLQEQSEAFLDCRDLLDDQEHATDLLKADIAKLKAEIKELRRTKEEQAEAIAKDRKAETERVARISELRRELKEARGALNDVTATLEKNKAEIKIVEARLSELKAEQDKIKQIEGRKKFMIFKLLQALKRANVLSVGFAYRTYIKPGTKNEGNWLSYGKSNKDSKRGVKEDGSDFCWFSLDNSDVNQRLAEDILTQQKEFHCKIYGTPALWILDDVTPENLAQIKADFSAAPYFTIETSPNNFTVAIAAENKKGLKTINPDKWRAVDDFLISRYNADKTGSAKHHYWRLPGCPRLNLDGYIPSITFGDKFSDTIIDNIYEQTRAQSEETTKATDKIREKIKLSKTGVEVPEWFIRKFVRFYNDINEDYPDVRFFRAMKDIIRSGRKNGNEIRYAEYCLKLLSVGALRDYGGRTKDPHKQEKIVVEALSEIIEEIEPEP